MSTSEAPAEAVTRSELLASAAARALAGRQLVFVGIGLPNLAAALAQRTCAPDLQLMYESGLYGSRPARLPVSVGDPWVVAGCQAIVPMADLFAYLLQGGRVDVALLGAAQIDRWGNVNTSVIGDFDAPDVRLPGSGGACDIVLNAREVFVVMRQARRSFVAELDFCTSPAARTRRAAGGDDGHYGAGVTRVITDLGVYDFGGADGQLRLTHLLGDATIDDVQDAAGWPVAIADDLETAPSLTEEELHTLRVELDPSGIYLQ